MSVLLQTWIVHARETMARVFFFYTGDGDGIGFRCDEVQTAHEADMLPRRAAHSCLGGRHWRAVILSRSRLDFLAGVSCWKNLPALSPALQPTPQHPRGA
jgi:hypothetical protein